MVDIELLNVNWNLMVEFVEPPLPYTFPLALFCWKSVQLAVAAAFYDLPMLHLLVNIEVFL